MGSNGLSWVAYSSRGRSPECLLELSSLWRCFLCQRFPLPRDQYSAESPRIYYDSGQWSGSDPCQTQTARQNSHPARTTRNIGNVSASVVKSSPSRPRQPSHHGPVEADHDIGRVGSIQVRRVIVLVVHENVQRRFHFGDELLRSDRAHQQKPVAFALLAVQRGRHHQLRRVLVYGERRRGLCGREKPKEVKRGVLFQVILRCLTCLHVVGDGVIGANVEPAEAPELPQTPGESVLCNVGVGGVLVRETQVLQVCLATLRHASVDKVQGDARAASAVAQRVLGDAWWHHDVQAQLLHRLGTLVWCTAGAKRHFNLKQWGFWWLSSDSLPANSTLSRKPPYASSITVNAI